VGNTVDITVKYCLIKQGIANQLQLLLAYICRESRVHGRNPKGGCAKTREALHHGSEIRSVGVQQRCRRFPGGSGSFLAHLGHSSPIHR